MPRNIVNKRGKIVQFIMNTARNPPVVPISQLTPLAEYQEKFRDYFTEDFIKFISDYMCDTTYEDFFTRSIWSMNEKKIIFNKCFNVDKFNPGAANKFTLSFSKDEIKNVFKHF